MTEDITYKIIFEDDIKYIVYEDDPNTFYVIDNNNIGEGTANSRDYIQIDTLFTFDYTSPESTGNNMLIALEGLSKTPVNHSYLEVSINGIDVMVGYNDKTLGVYFSSDNGITAKTREQITQGDQLLTGTGLEYTIANDIITIKYLTKL